MIFSTSFVYDKLRDERYAYDRSIIIVLLIFIITLYTALFIRLKALTKGIHRNNYKDIHGKGKMNNP